MKFENIFRSVRRVSRALSLATASLLCLHGVGFATPYIAPEELPRVSGFNRGLLQERPPLPAPTIRHSLDEVAYFAEYVQICDFLVRLQHPGPGQNRGGMIEGETGDVATIVQTDNTQEAIRVWAQYGAWTGNTERYSQPIQRAWEYCLRFPAWDEESNTGDWGYYRSHNCGWGIIAEMKYREVYQDTSYKWYADTCAAYLASHSLPFNQASWLRRLLPLVQGWSAGTLYLYALHEGNDGWRETALTEARRVRDWIEAAPSRLYNNEEWALCGGTALWGVCASLFDAYPDSGALWLPTMAPNTDTWQAPIAGGWNHSWNTWYGHAHHLVFAVLGDSTYWNNAVYIADSLLQFDTDDDGGITANGLDPDTVDQSWVSCYLDWMDLERIINALPSADLAAAGFVSPPPSVPHMAGDSLTVAVRVLNTGWLDLDSVLVRVEGEYEESLRVDLPFGLDTTIVFETPWVSPILPTQPDPIPLTLSVHHPQDMQPDNNEMTVFFDIRQGAYIEGYVRSDETGVGVPGTHLAFYHEAFPDSPRFEVDAMGEDGAFQTPLLMLGDYSVEVTPPLAYMPLSLPVTLTEPAGVSYLEASVEGTQVALIDDDAGAAYETYFLTTLEEFSCRSRPWDVALHGAPELERIPIVIWMTGDDSLTTLTLEDQSQLEDYLNNGGRLFLTGQNITEDLGTGSAFLRDVLHCDVCQHDVSSLRLFGTEGDPVSEGLEIFIVGSEGAANQRWPSSLTILPDGAECFHYDLVDSQAGGVRGDYGSGKYIFLGFGLEAVSGLQSTNTRTDVLERAFDWFDVLATSPVVVGHLPSRIELSQNWPNPFNGGTVISFYAPPGTGPVRLVVYNLLGQRIRTLFYCPSSTGHCAVQWNGKGDTGQELPTGTYLYRLSTPDEMRVRKLQIIR
jgi:hypothetical protein